ncbi:response regulator transcription factor [Opitutus terrae]|uniref:Two component transcriptional regulator, LuxR family n=1 Tax=Opitutus terrae (strain DSM 11246 / JCM 15787 / PB90-1) TaxID=452637 RepID=B1ZUT2_OPITP|nr:response regulator transcription factor [Opitutus terrae]ACB74966.1 two component transcriptional regulator, LuxR family [Opitutus terrae PB90-1]
MKRIRLLLVDDQSLFREGLRLLLAQQPDLEIVAEAANGEEAIAAAQRLAPAVVLMDLRMPVMNGVEATRRLMAGNFAGRILVLTTFEEDEEVFAALAAGAAGYLLKASPSDKLIAAIRLTARGESFLEPSVTAKVLAHFSRLAQQAPRPPKPPPPLAEPLSVREREVLGLLAEGRSNKEIASALAIAEGTVKNHMSNVLGKLGALDRTQAALRGRELGLV